VSESYTRVDDIADPELAVRWQERVDGWPQIAAYKRRARERLAEADPILDVGCGPGEDAAGLGLDRSIGVDQSRTMCAAARGRGVRVVRADGHALPFADGTFGGVRADRVVQHLAEPERALDELVRVTRPGGQVVVVDPDQETLVIHVPGVRQALVDRIKELRRDRGYRNGRLVSTLPELLRARGLVDVTIEPFGLVLTDPDDAFGLPTWVDHWRNDGPFTDADAAEWDAGMAAARARPAGLVYALLYFLVAGRVPA
jgi:SAM-dependent methyltransferase